MLVEQTVNALAYHRRVLTFSAMIGNKRKAKYPIKKESGLPDKFDSNLFVSAFRKHVVEIAKAKKESNEVDRDHQRDIKVYCYNNKGFTIHI